MNHFLEKLSVHSRVVCGVCSQISRKLGCDVLVSRLAAIILLIISPVMACIAYAVIAIIISQSTSRY
ncbi:PspC domain-containing protein [Shewanella intestini]|uniref:PspC domain-containing protein n=1 Tax=Shewanella intestini TaxID=2017544 RepID=A0ABS5I2M8_9GAMM|nr:MULTISPECIES: PspC domain-containing protein [Shewanella]MBR9727660.1 PspC domain-containing protein [Shewanella intestini]MRG35190.1 PspC domain-containing protein [Shewanella sp. XMDDZSB0408]